MFDERRSKEELAFGEDPHLRFPDAFGRPPGVMHGTGDYESIVPICFMVMIPPDRMCAALDERYRGEPLKQDVEDSAGRVDERFIEWHQRIIREVALIDEPGVIPMGQMSYLF